MRQRGEPETRPVGARWDGIRQWAASAPWGAWLPVATTYLLLVVLTYMLAELTWRSIGLFVDEQGDAGSGLVITEAPGGRDGGETLEGIAWTKFALFGREPEKAATSNTQRVAARPVKPSEPVRLTLYGTVASDDPAMSFAVVAVKGGKAEIYRVGDELQRGVILKSVDPWSVLVSVGGEDRTIQMIEVSQLPERPVTVPAPRADPAGSAAGERRISEPKIVKKLQGYRSSLLSNPLSLMDKLRAYPVKRGGEPYGIRVRPGTDRSLLGEVGLRSGDILIALNGVQLHDVRNLPDVIAQLKDQSEFSVELERAGKRQELRVVVDEAGGR